MESEEDFAAACRHSLAHGNLLSLRYLVPDIPWQAAKAHPPRLRQMQAWIARVLSLLLRAAETAQHPLSTPQETMASAPLLLPCYFSWKQQALLDCMLRKCPVGPCSP